MVVMITAHIMPVVEGKVRCRRSGFNCLLPQDALVKAIQDNSSGLDQKHTSGVAQIEEQRLPCGDEEQTAGSSGCSSQSTGGAWHCALAEYVAKD